MTEKVGLNLVKRFESLYEFAMKPIFQNYDQIQFGQSYWWNTQQQALSDSEESQSNENGNSTSMISNETAKRWRALTHSLRHNFDNKPRSARSALIGILRFAERRCSLQRLGSGRRGGNMRKGIGLGIGDSCHWPSRAQVVWPNRFVIWFAALLYK